MNEELVKLTFACCATAHLIATCIMAIYARHKVEYLSLAWIMGIFSASLLVVVPFSHSVSIGNPGILHPLMTWVLVCITYLQSIYTFGFSMPGYLQWERMWKYCSPIVLLGICYLFSAYASEHLTKVYSTEELFAKPWSPELTLRVLAFGLSIYYILNIYFLPRRIAKSANVPGYILGYSSVLALSCIYYVYVAFNYTPINICIFILLFTFLNLYMVFRTMENAATHLAKPVIQLETKDDDFAMDSTENKPSKDFNEINRKNYHIVEKWMHSHRLEWADHTFNRESLCEATGINRQLMLQCLRSQGHNNIHTYLMLYRVAELKRLIITGEATTIGDSFNAGFASPKTARSCFEKVEGVTLDSYMEQHKRA